MEGVESLDGVERPASRSSRLRPYRKTSVVIRYANIWGGGESEGDEAVYLRDAVGRCGSPGPVAWSTDPTRMRIWPLSMLAAEANALWLHG